MKNAMNVIHQTKDGTQLLVQEMTASHLFNTIKLLCNYVMENIEAASDDNASSAYHRKFARRVNYRVIDAEEAAAENARIIDNLFIYMGFLVVHNETTQAQIADARNVFAEVINEHRVRKQPKIKALLETSNFIADDGPVIDDVFFSD